jgi:malonyl-CoA O-methyltransferase
VKVRIRETLPTRDGYDAWAALYDGEDNALILMDDRVVPSLLPELSGLRVLEVGCGTGRVSLAMAREGAMVTAVDFSREMLCRARGKADGMGLGVEFVEADANRLLPFVPGAFDLVTSFLVTDHIGELGKFFGELRRVCRAGGEVLVTAVHPAMHLKGVIARFRDPATGDRVLIESVEHEICDYVNAGVGAGLSVLELLEHRVDAEIVNRSERAAKYLGWPIHLAMRCTFR